MSNSCSSNSVVSVSRKRRAVVSAEDALNADTPVAKEFRPAMFYFDKPITSTIVDKQKQKMDYAALCYEANDLEGFNLEQLECITHKGLIFPGMSMYQNTKKPIREAFEATAAAVAALHEVEVRQYDLRCLVESDGLRSFMADKAIESKGMTVAQVAHLKGLLRQFEFTVREYLANADPATVSRGKILSLPARQIPH